MAEPYPSTESESEPPGEVGSQDATELLSVGVAIEPPRAPEQQHASHGAIWWAGHRVVLEGLESVAVGFRDHGPRTVGLLLTGFAIFLLGLLSTFVLGVPRWTLPFVAAVSTAAYIWRRR